MEANLYERKVHFNIDDVVKHFKGGLYIFKGYVKHTETNEILVLYQQIAWPYQLFARPQEMFFSEVDKQKYPNAEQRYRFEVVGKIK